MKKPINIGHRGAMGHETENTIASVKKALELGVDMIEIDVFVLKTGEVVVFHDETLDNLTNHKGNIEEYSFTELQKVKVKGNHSIPTLADVITIIDKKVPLNIELKGKNTAQPTQKIVHSFYKKGWSKKDFVISSFLWEELKIYRKLDHKIPIAILTEENPIDAISIGVDVKAFAINPWYKTLTKQNVEYLHKSGFKINTYTVNEPEDINKVIELGVDGIFCNFPERLR
jgi:glycerophosphoryl diester phosphodiesterase